MIVHGVNGHRSRGTLCFIPVGCQIFPTGVLSFYQPDFLFASPAFQLFLPVDRVSDVIETFPVYETRSIVVVGEALERVRFVLIHPLAQVVCHAYVHSTS